MSTITTIQCSSCPEGFSFIEPAGTPFFSSTFEAWMSIDVEQQEHGAEGFVEIYLGTFDAMETAHDVARANLYMHHLREIECFEFERVHRVAKKHWEGVR